MITYRFWDITSNDKVRAVLAYNKNYEVIYKEGEYDSRYSNVLEEDTVAFHGSPEYFNEFSQAFIERNEMGYGTYLTFDKENAYYYTGDDEDGYVYTVVIPDEDGYNYIYEDKPITKAQYDEIVSPMSEQELQELSEYGFKEGCTGIQCYNALAQLMGEETASEFLNECVILGMKYHDLDNKDTYSCVMYSTDYITIIKTENAN